MNPGGAWVFFLVMLALAAMPSASVALVVARSSALGVRNGVAAALGIVAGDLVFLAVALLGVGALATTAAPVFATLRYAGAAYLAWLGWRLASSAGGAGAASSADGRRATLAASFAAGLVLTLGDAKAILFYASLLPVVLDMEALTGADIARVAATTVVTVGGVKIAYAVAARALAARLAARSFAGWTRKLAGGAMMACAAFLVWTA